MAKLLISEHPTIVILDDWQQNLFSITEGLRPDYTTYQFLDCGAFMTYLNEGHLVNLLLISMDALGDDSENIFQRLRSIDHIRDIPILLSLSLQDEQQEELALSLNASDYITRPYSVPIVLARIKKLIHVYLTLQISCEQSRYFNQKVADNTALIHKIRAELLSINDDVITREQETLMLLSRTADYRDPETGAHLKRMANYSKLIARNLGLSQVVQALLLEAAPLHDIGKLGIPEDILLKPGKLTSDEFEIMKQHASISYEILSGSTSRLMRAAAEIALTHHEQFDGSGYPKGLAGENIPLYGRIVAVADVFDALTSERTYKTAWSLEKAADYLRERRGQHFDPLCVDAFLQNWGEVVDIYERYREG